MNTLVIETHLYSDIELTRSDAEIITAYTDEPHTTARIRRTGNRTRDTPIGTRTGSNLEAFIDDRKVVLSPGSARVLKRSYRVRIEFDQRILTLSATSLEESRLLEGPTDTGDNAFGDLTQTHHGGVDVSWAVPFRFMRKTVTPPVPTRDDVLIAVCAAAAFGTGGLSVSMIALGFIEAVFP